MKGLTSAPARASHILSAGACVRAIRTAGELVRNRSVVAADPP
jgi:hypothetical protein